MTRRPRRTAAAVLVAVVLLAAGVLVAVSSAQALLGVPPWLAWGTLADLGAALTWNAPAALAGAGAVAAVGLLLLLCAMVPGSPTVLPLVAVPGLAPAGVTRRSLSGTLRAAASTVTGVDAAAVRVRGRTVTATVRTSLRDPVALCADVRAALGERLDAIAPRRPPRIRVRVRPGRTTGPGTLR